MEPLLAFGIITDIQYADIDDAYNFLHTKIRHYRNAQKLTKNAVRFWDNSSIKMDFILQLGDIIDGQSMPHHEDALRTVLELFEGYRKKLIHVIGNHELYVFKRMDLRKRELFSPNFFQNCSILKDELYFAHKAHRQLKIVVLDCYEIGVLGYTGNEPEYCKARTMLDTINPNVDKRDSTGLHDLERRIVRYNGGLSDAQLNWLDEQLSESTKACENVIIIGHVPLHPDSSFNTTLCWNYKEVMDVLNKHGCVIAYLAGHAHEGGSAVDDRGVHFIVVPAILESPDEDAFATAYMYRDRIEIRGQGIVDSFTFNLKFPITDEKGEI